MEQWKRQAAVNTLYRAKISESKDCYTWSCPWRTRWLWVSTTTVIDRQSEGVQMMGRRKTINVLMGDFSILWIEPRPITIRFDARACWQIRELLLSRNTQDTSTSKILIKINTSKHTSQIRISKKLFGFSKIVPWKSFLGLFLVFSRFYLKLSRLILQKLRITI